MKSIRIRSFSGPYFNAFGLNTGQKNSEYGHFSRSAKTKQTEEHHNNYGVLAKLFVESRGREGIGVIGPQSS